MASLMPLEEKKLMDVKLGALPSWILMRNFTPSGIVGAFQRGCWILMRNFTPSGIVGAFQRGYDQYYNKYINAWKGSISGINMVLAVHMVFSYCISYKELKNEQRHKYH